MACRHLIISSDRQWSSNLMVSVSTPAQRRALAPAARRERAVTSPARKMSPVPRKVMASQRVLVKATDAKVNVLAPRKTVHRGGLGAVVLQEDDAACQGFVRTEEGVPVGCVSYDLQQVSNLLVINSQGAIRSIEKDGL